MSTHTSEDVLGMQEPPHPFNRPNADIIIRTADHVDFRLHSQILLEASTVFETLLSLPQPNTDSGDAPSAPVIDIAESSTILEPLMRICYPIIKPKKRPFEDIEPILNAALKYEMELPIDTLSEELLAYAVESPLRVWAIACRTGLEEVARRAAELTLTASTIDLQTAENLDGVTAGHVFRLHEFHRSRGDVDSSFKLLTQLPSFGPLPREDAPMDSFDPNVPHPDISFRSADDIDYALHKGVVSAASPILRQKIEDAVVASASSPSDSSEAVAPTLPSIRLDERGAVLAPLFKMCYPGEFDIALPTSPALVTDTIVAAQRYSMHGVATALRKHWSAVVSEAPLVSFLCATRSGLADCARDAAQAVLEDALEGIYYPEMEHAPALPYHRLLVHYRSCREIASTLLKDVSNAAIQHRNYTNDYYSHRPHFPHERTPSPYEPIIIQPPSFGFGPPVPNTYQHGSPSQTWLKGYVDGLLDAIAQHPGKMASTTDELFEAASAAGMWCGTCTTLVADLCQIGKTLRDIPIKVKDVEFEFEL